MVYQRLCGVEKAKKVALIAWILKPPTMINTMLSHWTRWRTESPKYA
jgi:hypothetical protein